MSDEVGNGRQDPLGLTTVKDAARQLAVPVAYLQREVKAGHVPSLPIGKSVRVDVKAVEIALKRQAAGMFADQLYGELSTPALMAPLTRPEEPERNPRVGGTPGTV